MRESEERGIGRGQTLAVMEYVLDEDDELGWRMRRLQDKERIYWKRIV